MYHSISKKVISILLTCLLVFAEMPLLLSAEGMKTAAASDLFFEPNGDGTCTVYGDNRDMEGELTIPAYSPEGDVVIAVGREAFAGISGLTAVHIPASVQTVEAFAFCDCTALETVSLPYTVSRFGDRCFAGCTSLRTVENAGYGIFLTEYNGHYYTYSHACPVLWEEAEAACEALGGYLATVTSKEELDLIASITNAPRDSRFWACWLGDCMADEKDEIMWGIDPELSCTPYHAFLREGRLRVAVPDDTAVLPFVCEWDSLPELENLFVVGTAYASETPATTIPHGMFDGCRALETVSFPCGFDTVERTVRETELGLNADHLWADHFSLRETTYRCNGSCHIEPYAFRNCEKLCSFPLTQTICYFPGMSKPTEHLNCSSICDAAFSGCSSLCDALVFTNLGMISRSAFAGCAALPSITIPVTTDMIGFDAFDGCDLLTIYCAPNSVAYGHAVDNEIPYVLTGEAVPTFSYDEYGGGEYSIRSSAYLCGDVRIPAETPDGARVYCVYTLASYSRSVTSAYFDEGIQKIVMAFISCPNLTDVFLPDSVTEIDPYAFEECYNVTIHCSAWNGVAIAFAEENGYALVTTGSCTALTVKNLPKTVIYPVGGELELAGLILSAAFDEVGEKDVSAGFTVEPYDFSTEGEKTVTVHFAGQTVSFTVTVDASIQTLPESPHPYPASMDKTWTYTYPGEVDQLEIRFTGQSYIAWDDTLYFYDQYGLAAERSGSWLADEPVIVDGNSFSMRLVSSEWAGEWYGFTIEEIRPVTVCKHQFTATVTAPDCVTEGYTTHTCDFCGKSYTDEPVAALGHDPGEDGFCRRCGLPNDTVAAGKCGDAVQWRLNPLGDSSEYALTLSGTGSTWEFEREHTPWYEYRLDIRSITVEEGVTWLGRWAFEGCFFLREVSLPDGLLGMTANTFEGCANLRELALPSSLRNIGYATFANCESLKTLDLSATGIKSIPESAFSYCTSMYRIALPEGLTEIGQFAFAECYSLVSIELSETLTEIMYNAFNGCLKLAEVVNHSDLEITAGNMDNGMVAYYAEEVHTGESRVEELNGYLFGILNGTGYLLGYTEHDAELTLPENYGGQPYEIYRFAFDCVAGPKKITVPAGVSRVGYGAFNNCYFLTDLYFAAEEQPEGWDADWKNGCDAAVHWGVSPVTPGVAGDINGDNLLSIQDVTALLLALSQAEPGNGNIALYDVSKDGIVSIQDVTILLQMLASAA